jgi:predicted peroxiredoxin
MEEKNKLVIVVSRGFDDERASVAWSIANGGLKNDIDVSIFLVSSGVDWARKGAGQAAHLNPFDPPLDEMIQTVVEAGCRIMVCPPCAKSRGLGEGDLIDAAVIQGSGGMHELIKAGAQVLSF